MYTSTFFLTALLALTHITIATPPACLLSAIGVQANPADLKSLCGALEPQVVGNITQKCTGDNLSSAQSAFSATCLSSESVTIHFSSSASTQTGSLAATTTGASSKSTATGASGSGSKTSGTATVTGSGATSTATGNSASFGMAPHNYVEALMVLAAGFAGQYFL